MIFIAGLILGIILRPSAEVYFGILKKIWDNAKKNMEEENK